jgi:hypothetical protein
MEVSQCLILPRSGPPGSRPGSARRTAVQRIRMANAMSLPLLEGHRRKGLLDLTRTVTAATTAFTLRYCNGVKMAAQGHLILMKLVQDGRLDPWGRVHLESVPVRTGYVRTQGFDKAEHAITNKIVSGHRWLELSSNIACHVLDQWRVVTDQGFTRCPVSVPSCRGFFVRHSA